MEDGEWQVFNLSVSHCHCVRDALHPPLPETFPVQTTVRAWFRSAALVDRCTSARPPCSDMGIPWCAQTRAWGLPFAGLAISRLEWAHPEKFPGATDVLPRRPSGQRHPRRTAQSAGCHSCGFQDGLRKSWPDSLGSRSCFQQPDFQRAEPNPASAPPARAPMPPPRNRRRQTTALWVCSRNCS